MGKRAPKKKRHERACEKKKFARRSDFAMRARANTLHGLRLFFACGLSNCTLRLRLRLHRPNFVFVCVIYGAKFGRSLGVYLFYLFHFILTTTHARAHCVLKRRRACQIRVCVKIELMLVRALFLYYYIGTSVRPHEYLLQ